jgi:N-acetylglutamate synthase/N-acetylornithine aminotransferase
MKKQNQRNWGRTAWTAGASPAACILAKQEELEMAFEGFFQMEEAKPH